MFAVMTQGEALQYISEKLSAIYETGEANSIAGLLLENLTATRKTEFTINKNTPLSEEQSIKLNQLLPRLLNHEPVQYILTESWFYGLKFYVDKNVLIPRPETEELVDWVIRNIKFPFKDLKILDIGTGSGCIAVSLKRKLRKAEVWACDISNEALNVASKNSSTLQADINFVQLDFLNKAERNQLLSFDIIVSNPPYVPENDKMAMQKNVLNFEPHTALFVPDNNVLVFYNAIADFAKTHLNKDGFVYCEIHETLSEEVTELFSQKGFKTEIKKDMQGKERMIKASARNRIV